MASKTQSGQQFSARSMNGIIELDDGAGTLISGGVIQTNDINTGNLTSDFISANNLLEGDVDETITGKWTFTQSPYITATPTNANDAVNKQYVDNNFVDLTTTQYVAGNKIFTALITFQNVVFMLDTRMDTNYSPTIPNQVATKKYTDDNFVGLLGTQFISGTKTFANAFMGSGYIPVSPLQITTKEYVDSIVGAPPTLEDVLQQGNNANGESMIGLSNLTMNTGYSPTLDLELSTKNYSDVFTGKIDATNNSFFTTIELFNPPFQLTGTTTIPVGTYTIQSLLTQIATSLALTFSATLPPSVVITEWTYDITTNKVSAVLPTNSTIPELTHRIDPLLQLLGFQGSRTPFSILELFNNSPPTQADHPQHLPHVRQYVDDNFLNIANNPFLTNIRDNSLVGGTLQLYYNNTTGEIGKLLSVSPIIDLEYVLQQGNSANGNTMTDVGSINMAVGYIPSSSRQVATKSYVDGLVAGGGITEALLFDSNGNSRFQKPSASPTNFYGSNNTMIGFESAKMLPNDPFTLRNTFLGYRSGYYFAQGYVGSTDNTFLGSYAGWDGTTTPYSYNRTTCIGYRSYGDKSDQIALGNGLGEIRARGSLLVDGFATFNGSGTGLIVNTISSFTQNIFRKIGSISYQVLDELSASTTYQTLANLATSYVSNDTTYFSTKYIYDNFYPTANCFATFFQKASIQFNYDNTPTNDECYSTSYLNTTFAGVSSTITQRTPKYFTEWRYSTSNNNNTGTLISWSNGSVPFSNSNPLPANNTTSTFTLGEGVVAGTEYIGQRSSSGTWTATVAGMYKIELVLQPYQSWTMRLWIEYFRNGSWATDSYIRSNGAVGIAGTSPYGQVCNYSSIQYLEVGESMRGRGFASGSSSYGYIYTHSKSSYWKITRLSGYT